MAWTTLSFAFGSILTSAKMTQMYDNFAALAAADASAPDIVPGAISPQGAASGFDADLLDGQHGSYYAVASTTATSLAAKVDDDVGNPFGVGAIAKMNVISGAITAGSTTSGSNLTYSYLDGATVGAISPSGTWRNITGATINDPGNGLFQRIS